MAETIWKFPLRQKGKEHEFFADMPKDALVLSCDWQDGTFVVWAMVDRDAPREDRYFYILGTGHDIPCIPGAFRFGAKYVGRVELRDTPLLLQFHVFDTGLWRPALDKPDLNARVEFPHG